MGVCKNTGYKSGKWHDVTWYEKALLPYEDVPAEMIPIGEMEKETVDKILASFEQRHKTNPHKITGRMKKEFSIFIRPHPFSLFTSAVMRCPFIHSD